MSADDQSKYKNAASWITSIAISVLCCSILFVLFASYLVDLKADIRDDMMHINAMEERQNQILANLEALAKRLPPPAVVVAPAVAPAPTDTAPPSITPPTMPGAGSDNSTAPTSDSTATPPASSVTVPVTPPAAKP